MCIVIQNIGGDMQGVCRYEVRINDQPPIAVFEHNRNMGLGRCLERAAEAVRAAEAKEIEHYSRRLQEKFALLAEQYIDTGGPCSK